MSVPGRTEWLGYEADLDSKWAHGLYFGKKTSEVLEHFEGGLGIERASELAFLPRKVFQYYVFAFVEYLRSPAAAGDSDAASPFLHLLLERERQDPGSVAEIYAELDPHVEFVAAHQEYFDADRDIYGDFTQHAAAIRKAVGAADTGH